MPKAWKAWLAAIALAAIAPFAAADVYPAKTVRIIVPYAAGGGTDILARLFAQKLTERWGQTVIVENRPGGDGIIGSEAVAKAPADGYNLVLVVGAHVINPSLKSNMPYDVIRDFAPVTLVAASPWVVVVNPAVPAKNIRELIAVAKANPGQLSFGSSEPSSRLAGEQFKSLSGTELLHVPYKGGSQIMNDMLGGHVQVGFTSVLTVLQHYKSGKLRVLGVSGTARSPNMPDIPTVIEAGLPGYDPMAWYGLYAPRGTPKEVTEKIQREVASIAALPDVKERLVELGAQPVASTPEQFTRFTVAEYTKFAKIIKDAGIKAD
ncbi:MAG TPA: tripartite tricarboxylate transporter substrate binding protein [Usitatibacter sp.]|nr:tripartite tricarboxylate transporter substrate binding protein [Usitatibacter sp.]